MICKNVQKLYFHVLLIFISACKSNHAIIDRQTGERIVGYRNARYIIGKTKESGVKDIQYCRSKGLDMRFYGQGIPVLREANIDNASFCTNKGIKVGDPLSKVKEAYGPSISDTVSIYGSGVYLGVLDITLYHDWGFARDSVDKVEGFALGNDDYKRPYYKKSTKKK